MLPNSVFDMPLDVYAFKIYVYLVCCAGNCGECWPTMNKISQKLGIAVSTVQDRINHWKEFSKHYHHKINYIFLYREGCNVKLLL